MSHEAWGRPRLRLLRSVSRSIRCARPANRVWPGLGDRDGAGMTDEEWDEIEHQLVQTFGEGPLESFAEVAGGIIKRELLERGLGGVDPGSLDAEFAGRILIEAWAEAAAHCFPERDPAEIVDRLAAIVQTVDAQEAQPLPSLSRHH